MIALNPESTVEPDSDIDLMLRVQADDRAAFDRLVARHRERTVRLIIGMSIDPHLAEDLTQDLFVRVYQARKRYLPSAQFSTWIGAIARRLVLNAHRDGVRWRRTASLDGIGWPDRHSAARPLRGERRGADPAESVVAEERREALWAVIGRLSERERTAVTLFHFGGKSYQAVARQTGSTPKAIKSLLARARAKIREAMAHSPIAAELLEEFTPPSATRRPARGATPNGARRRRRPSTTGLRGESPTRRTGPGNDRSF